MAVEEEEEEECVLVVTRGGFGAGAAMDTPCRVNTVTRPVTRVGCREKNTVQYSTEIHTGVYLALHKI